VSGGASASNWSIRSSIVMLLTRIVACLRNGTPYQVRDVDGSPITPEQGRAIIAERYQIPPEVRAARRAISNEASIEGASRQSVHAGCSSDGPGQVRTRPTAVDRKGSSGTDPTRTQRARPASTSLVPASRRRPHAQLEGEAGPP
jgi:hypothetical protein